MAIALALGLGLLGGLVGYGISWVSVFLEKQQKLEAEEISERDAYIQAEPNGEPWIMEQYGWGWMEKVALPILGAGLFVAVALHSQLWSTRLSECWWISFFLLVSLFDIKHRLILNWVSYPAVLVALGLAVITPGLNLESALIGGVGLGLVFLLLSIITGGGFGLGDAKLGVVIGAVTGFSLTGPNLGAVHALVYGLVLGGGCAGLLLAFRILGRKDHLPYGPFLCLGAILVFFFG